MAISHILAQSPDCTRWHEDIDILVKYSTNITTLDQSCSLVIDCECRCLLLAKVKKLTGRIGIFGIGFARRGFMPTTGHYTLCMTKLASPSWSLYHNHFRTSRKNIFHAGGAWSSYCILIICQKWLRKAFDSSVSSQIMITGQVKKQNKVGKVTSSRKYPDAFINKIYQSC